MVSSELFACAPPSTLCAHAPALTAGPFASQRGTDIDGEANHADDRSGSSVSLSSNGGVVAIGAPWNDGGGWESGHVRVYAWSGAAWVQARRVIVLLARWVSRYPRAGIGGSGVVVCVLGMDARAPRRISSVTQDACSAWGPSLKLSCKPLAEGMLTARARVLSSIARLRLVVPRLLRCTWRAWCRVGLI